MKKKIVIRSTVSRPPTKDELLEYYREYAKLISIRYSFVDSKVIVKEKDGVFILINSNSKPVESID